MAAVGLPAAATEKLATIGSAFGAGTLEAVAYRANKTAGMAVTFVGGIMGLLLSLTMRGLPADIAEGVACTSAGSMGHMIVSAAWPKQVGGGPSRRQIGESSRTQIGGGNGTKGRYPAPMHEEEFEEVRLR